MAYHQKFTEKAAEIYQNPNSQESLLVSKEEVQAYKYPLRRRPFMGRWQRAPMHIIGRLGPQELGQLITVEQRSLVLRKRTRVLLEAERALTWKLGSVLHQQRPLSALRSQATETRDITSGIPRIDALLELRIQTGTGFFLDELYQKFLKQGSSNKAASRKALHSGQRLIVDGVQRIYFRNGVRLDDKHLELIVRPMAFVQICGFISIDRIIEGQNHPLELLERLNWARALKNSHQWKPKLGYKPLLLGLTKTALRKPGFLSAASFQETSRVLTRAALRRRMDYLLGLKENLIMGMRLPIGTNARFLTKNSSNLNMELIVS